MNWKKQNHYRFGQYKNEIEDYHQYVAAALNACWDDDACSNSKTYDELKAKLTDWQLENIPMVAEGMAGFAESAVGKGIAAANAAKKSGGRTPCNSFPPDTLVLMADGQIKPIGEIKPGDMVAATDPQTGQTADKPVTGTIITPDDTRFTELTLSASGEEGSSNAADTLVSTSHHPYWDETANRWIQAESLQPGHHVSTIDHASVAVLSARTYSTQPQTAHNLTVADLHTYYVLAGTTPVLVHNSGGCLPALRDWSSQRFQFGNQTFLLDKKGMEHILTRHHPTYWDGSVKAQQSFFDSRMSIDDVQSAIGDVMRQNRDTLIRRGSQGMYQVRGTVNGVDYVLGMNKGRVGQFYPVNP
jgi:hypothetical protein